MGIEQITFNVTEKTKQAFEVALFLSGKEKDEVFESLAKEFAVKVLKKYQIELSEPPSEEDFEPEDCSKALAKIPVWAARRRGQIGAQIVKAFFLCEVDGIANRSEMREVFLKNNPDKTAASFDNNFASMCTEKGNSQGKFFVLTGSEVCPHSSVRETLYKYREEFLK